jgi:hypothetical protein
LFINRLFAGARPARADDPDFVLSFREDCRPEHYKNSALFDPVKATSKPQLRGKSGVEGVKKLVLRVANLPEYRNVDLCKSFAREVADELKIEGKAPN